MNARGSFQLTVGSKQYAAYSLKYALPQHLASSEQSTKTAN